MVGNRRNTLFWYDCWVGKMPLNLKFSRLFDLAVFKECSVEEMSTLGWRGVGVETLSVSVGGGECEGVFFSIT